jgi:hypothetical protein
MKFSSPAAQRNIGPIGDVLEHWLPERGLVLELASGSGEHGLAFARRFRNLIWQPSDPDAQARASIAAWQADSEGAENYRPPVAINAADQIWPVEAADVIMAVNMVHISPWAATLGMMAGATRILPEMGALILYGPYFEDDVVPAPSNLAFDESLKSRNEAWGIRHLDDVRQAARHEGLELVDRKEMPANNLMLLFRKRS